MNSQAAAIAIVLLIAGCGGGGGTDGGGSGSVPAPADPPTSAPVVAGIASFSGFRREYSIAGVAGGYTVRSSNGAANVSGANAIRFSDMTINLAIGDKAVAFGMAKVRPLIELYIAFLNQVPDADSLGLWIDQIDPLKVELTMAQAADRLHAQAVLAPSVSGYSELMLHDEFVTAVYKGVFGRFDATAPTPAEIQVWSGRIDKGGISRGALVLAMLEAARSGSGDLVSVPVIQLLDNRLAVGEHFAVQQGINYNSAEESVARRVAIAAAVNVAAANLIIGFSDASFNLVAGK